MTARQNRRRKQRAAKRLAVWRDRWRPHQSLQMIFVESGDYPVIPSGHSHARLAVPIVTCMEDFDRLYGDGPASGMRDAVEAWLVGARRAGL